MTVVTTLDVNGLTAPGYLHITTPIESGFRSMEICDEKSRFDRFVEARLAPAHPAVGLQRQTAITVTPLHNHCGPALEWPGLIATLPGAPRSRGATR
jgi:hypothetical protein